MEILVLGIKHEIGAQQLVALTPIPKVIPPKQLAAFAEVALKVMDAEISILHLESRGQMVSTHVWSTTASNWDKNCVLLGEIDSTLVLPPTQLAVAVEEAA